MADDIHIKASHKGLLREALHVGHGDILVSRLEKASHSKSPKLRKQAQFALNALKWSKK